MNNKIKSISEFMTIWSKQKEPSVDLANDYLDICDKILYESKSSVSEVLELVKINIENWALANSSVYLKSKIFYSKEDLEDKFSWYVPKLEDESFDSYTSGSTTGFHFMYRKMKATFEKIEWDNHYDMILNEFNIGPNPNILYFFPEHFKKNKDDILFCEPTPQPYLNSHGRSRNSIVHYANFDIYKSDPLYFFSNLFDYLSNNPIDIFFSSGPTISSMCHYIKKLGYNNKISYLLSQTNEMMIQEDARFLIVDNNYFDNICDHMRCWDGGASFFTCKFGNYHIMDNLSWCEEIEGKLISTDYFNFISPFIRYWNGDICSLSSDFLRCDCGRLFREFEFLENRPFSISGVNLEDLKLKMIELNLNCIKQVKCYTDLIDVVTTRELSDFEKNKIKVLEPRFNFVFSIKN